MSFDVYSYLLLCFSLPLSDIDPIIFADRRHKCAAQTNLDFRMVQIRRSVASNRSAAFWAQMLLPNWSDGQYA